MIGTGGSVIGEPCPIGLSVPTVLGWTRISALFSVLFYVESALRHGRAVRRAGAAARTLELRVEG